MKGIARFQSAASIALSPLPLATRFVSLSLSISRNELQALNQKMVTWLNLVLNYSHFIEVIWHDDGSHSVWDASDICDVIYLCHSLY